MLKLFISQPMNGMSNEEILQKRKEAKEYVKNIMGEEVEEIDSFFENAPHDAKPLWYIGKSIQLLSEADCVFFAKNWYRYRGCRIEHAGADQYGLKKIYEQ